MSTPRKAKDWATQLRLDRQSLIERPEFLRVFNDLMDMTGVFRVTHAGEQTHASAFNEGMRNVGLKLFAELTQADAQFLLKAMPHRNTETPTEEPTA